ncbi:MAG: circularly permuted type 2 ATP-grasp protein [Acidimicrobiales bacterium]
MTTNQTQSAAEGPETFWSGYAAGPFWDEMLGVDVHRESYAGVMAYLEELGDELLERQAAAELAIASMGISFAVYAEGGAIDRAWPYDVIPRVIDQREWAQVSEGLVQRLEALNLFIGDIYGDAKALADGIVPSDIVLGSPDHRPECRGIEPPHGTWAHICGSDLVRGADGLFRVLEDNLRVPSGVAYMIENRQISKRVLADAFRDIDIQPVDSYPFRLQQMLASLTPRPGEVPVIAVLTPGIYNSAYFEHTFLAQQMGALLVQGSDLVVDDDDVCYARTVGGLVRVDVIYRRVDDAFLDPEVFRSDSLVGTPGLMRAWRSGNVALANAPGAGVADDKVVYAFVPDLIRYYLDEEPKLPSVPTYVCLRRRRPALRARAPRRARGEAGQRERRQGHLHRDPGHSGGEGRDPCGGRGPASELDRAAHHRAVDRPDAVRRPARCPVTSTCGPSCSRVPTRT